jgi:phosphoribosyl 1,2-cyclic phosphodiesterase
MKIKFWGTRGSVASPGRETIIYGGNTTCLEVTLSSGQTVIIDAGTGIRTLGDALLARGTPLEILLLMTHVHWDHVMGFPFFGPLFRSDTRIMVDGSRKAMEGLRRIFSSNYVDGTWPVTFRDLKAGIEAGHGFRNDRLDLGSTVIESHSIQHPQGGLGFKFVEESGTFVFLTDNELVEHGWAGTSFKDFVVFCRNADILVHDCQYVPEEMDIKRGWGHSDVNSVAKLAAEGGVKKLLLFHHDPWRSDAAVTSMVRRCAQALHEINSQTHVEAATEGSTIVL